MIFAMILATISIEQGLFMTRNPDFSSGIRAFYFPFESALLSEQPCQIAASTACAGCFEFGRSLIALDRLLPRHAAKCSFVGYFCSFVGYFCSFVGYLPMARTGCRRVNQEN